MYIEELIHFDKKELALSKLIFSKYRLKWKLVLSGYFIAIGVFFYFSLISDVILLKILSLMAMPVSLYGSMIYSKKKTLLILRMNCIKYRLGSVNVWENRFFIIQNIRMKKLYDFLSRYDNPNQDTMRFIIECLRAENTSPRYKYRFVQVFSMLFSVVIGAFLAAVIALPDMLTTLGRIVSFFKPIIGFSLLFVLFTWFLDEMLLKEIFKLSSNKYGRLIRTLENCCLKYSEGKYLFVN